MQINIYSSLNTAPSKCLMAIAFFVTLAVSANQAQAQECSLSPYPSAANFTAAGSAVSVEITRIGECTLTIVSYPSWIVSVQNNYSYILIQAGQNTGAARSGSVWLDYGGNNYYVSLTQAGVPSPVITSQPSDQNRCENETASFSVTASNASSYQWYQSFNGASYTIVSGATSSTYSFAITLAMSNTRYRCVISNVSGSVTSNGALLTVSPATQVGNPLDVTVCSNASSATFSIGAAGSNLNFQWYRAIGGGAFVPLASESGFSGINEPTLTITDINGNANAQFKCYVYGTCPGGGLSNAATLFIASSALNVSNPQNQLICFGEEATFTVNSSNGVSFQWEEKTTVSGEFTSIGGATSNTYTFTPTQDQAGAQYRCVVNGNCGSQETTGAAILEFHNVSFSITKQPEDKTMCEQEHAEIKVEASAANLLYQWQVSTNGGSTFSDIPGMTDATYSFLATYGQNGNKYLAKVRHSLCNSFKTSSAMTLIVKQNPVLTATITASSTSVSMGEDVTITVSPSSPGPGETWRWYVLNNNYSLTIGSEASIKVNPYQTITYYVNASTCLGNSKSITINYVERFSDKNYIYTVHPKIPMDGSMSLRTEENVIEEIMYFDGLGRPIQSVQIQGSPSKKDIVQPIIYDALGREAVKYLPFTNGNTGLYKENPVASQLNFYTTDDTPTIDADQAPFAVTVFEPSPLNRVLKQGAPGEAWQPETNRTINNEYLLNASGQVLLFKYDQPTGEINAKQNGAFTYYEANQLFVNKTIDEHQNEVVEFTDKEGRVVLKNVQHDTVAGQKQYASTYYIYDDLGNLVVVLPPEGVKQYLTVSSQP